MVHDPHDRAVWASYTSRLNRVEGQDLADQALSQTPIYLLQVGPRKKIVNMHFKLEQGYDKAHLAGFEMPLSCSA